MIVHLVITGEHHDGSKVSSAHASIECAVAKAKGLMALEPNKFWQEIQTNFWEARYSYIEIISLTIQD